MRYELRTNILSEQLDVDSSSAGSPTVHVHLVRLWHVDQSESGDVVLSAILRHECLHYARAYMKRFLYLPAQR